MEITKYTIYVHSKNKTNLGMWNGAQIRSILKNHSARIDCVNTQLGHCSDCPNTSCLSRRLFDSKYNPDGRLISNLCYIEVPFRTDNLISDNITFVLFVLGKPEARILEIFNKGLFIGTPKEIFEITDIKADTQDIDISSLEDIVSNTKNRYKLILETPYVYKAKDSIDTYKLGKSITSRITSVINACGIDYKYDYNTVNQGIHNLKIRGSKLEAVYYSKYSSRIHKQSLIKGYIGEIILEGDFSRIYNSLKLVETLHIGKEITMGFGKIRFEEVGDTD